MKIVFLVTREPGKICGVCDYTEQLAATFSSLGKNVAVELQPAWSLKAVLDLRKKYVRQENVVFHLQYPSLGMGNSIWPGLMPLFFGPGRTFVTLHEFSIFNILRKAIFVPFLLLSKIVFTNDYERDFFHRYLPFLKGRTRIIPIGNNIAVAESAAPREKKIVFFGHVTEGKGIEHYLDALEIMAKRGVQPKAMIVGVILNEQSPIAKRVRMAHKTLGLELHLGLSAMDVSKILSSASVAILPFADGISEKRGSALACFKHGLSLITCHSEKTPPWMRECSYHMNSAEDAAVIALGLLDGTLPGRSGKMLADELALREWPAIAKRHLDLYAS